MLDIHPPEHTPHSWRDFFIHIATIVVGLLIAIGLEQTVEAVHRQHERTELLQRLHEESQQIVKECTQTKAVLVTRDQQIASRIEQLQAVLWKHQTLAAGEPSRGPNVLQRPDDPIWRAAKTGGLAPRLTSEEIDAYSEVEIIAAKVEIAYDRLVVIHSDRTAFEHEFHGPDFDPDFSHASPVDLRQYLHLLTQERTAVSYVDLMVAGMSGAEAIILKGSYDAREIRNSEQNQQSTK
ncbi:MAG: hypothetical protein ABI286_12175 [Edaphobacter sp.]